MHVQCEIIPGSIRAALFSGHFRVYLLCPRIFLISAIINDFLGPVSTLVYTICWDRGTNLPRLANGQ